MMAKRGFTLIEICIVLAVVLILASLLFPVLWRTREKGYQATCQNNLRQMHLGFVQYVQDSDGNFPPVLHSLPSPRSRTFSGTDYVLDLQPYVKDSAIFLCPTSQARMPDRDTDYQYNYGKLMKDVYSADGDSFIFKRVGRQEPQVESRSTTLVLWDIGPMWDAPENHGERPILHSGGGNYAFLDGHGKWRLPSQKFSSSSE